MVDITNKPYFNYDAAISKLMQPIQSLADVSFHAFRRKFMDGKQFPLYPSDRHNYWCRYWGDELFRYGVFEKDVNKISSSYHMWDHLSFAPPEIYEYLDNQFGIGHGLTIIQQNGDHVDSFVFSSTRGNSQINNFYLSQKELFVGFIQDFYLEMQKETDSLMHHCFIAPEDIHFVNNPIPTLTERQLKCGVFLSKGFKTKEIARFLDLSPRTIEIHLNILKRKFRVKDREQLISALRRFT